MTFSFRRRSTPLVIISLLSVVLYSCSIAGNGPARTPTVEQAVATVAPSSTPAPTLTSTPAPQQVVLLASDSADQALVNELREILAVLAEQDGLRFQERPSLAPFELEKTHIVVALPPAPDLPELIRTPGDTQFLAIGFPDVESAERVSVIRGQSDRPDLMGFLAGYLAAVITPDWRVAVVTEDGTPTGSAVQLSYFNGATYFCGLCRPVYPPFPASGYPLSVGLSAQATPADWQATVTYFSAWSVGTVFVYPTVANEQFLSLLAEAGFQIVLSGTPPADVRQAWVASLGYQDPVAALEELWPDLLAGKGEFEQTMPLGLVEVNPDLLSAGRQQLVERMLLDLHAGYIDTGVDPLTGETR